MKLKQLKLQNFRNYQQALVELDPGVNMICGENAQGKTNLLEAVYFLSHLKTFRSGNKKNMIAFDREMGEAAAVFDGDGRENTI